MPTIQKQIKPPKVEVPELTMSKKQEGVPQLNPEASRINKLRVYYLSISFFIVHLGFNPCSGLIGVTLKNMGFENLGFISLIVVNVAHASSTFIAPYVMTRFSITFNKLFSVSALGYLIIIIPRRIAVWCAENTSTDGICNGELIYWSVILTSVLQGLCVTFLWITQRVFLAKCCIDDNRGTFIGIFYVILQASSIFGSLLSSWVNGSLGFGNFINLVLALQIVACVLLILIKQPVSYIHIPQQQLTNSNTEKVNEKLPPKKVVTPLNLIKFDFRLDIFKLLPILLVAGSVNGVLSSIVPMVALKAIQSDDTNFISQKFSQVLMVQGGGAMLTAKVSAWAYTKYGKRFVINTITGLNICLPILIYITHVTNNFTYYYFIGFIGGCLDSGNCVISASIMQEYQDFPVEANTLNIFTFGFGFVIFMIIGVYVSFEILVPLLLLVLLMVTACAVGNVIFKNKLIINDIHQENKV